MIADQNFMNYVLCFFITASATAYGQRRKFVRAKHSATAEGESFAYSQSLEFGRYFKRFSNFECEAV